MGDVIRLSSRDIRQHIPANCFGQQAAIWSPHTEHATARIRSDSPWEICGRKRM